MRPRITFFLSEAGFPDWWVPNFTVMLLLAMATGIYLTHRLWRRYYGHGSVVTWMGIALPISFAGAKALYLLEYGWQEDWRAMLSGGISLYGGVAGLLVGLWCAQRIYGFSLPAFLDCGAPSLALTLAIGRIGCFLAGCNGGLPTSLPWGVSFPPHTSAHGWQVSHGWITQAQSLSFPAHPTQLYETVASLIAFILLLRLLRDRQWEGQTFLVAMLWYSSFRFMEEFLRADPGSWPLAGLTFIQLIALPMTILSGLVLMIHSWNPTVQKPSGGPAP